MPHKGDSVIEARLGTESGAARETPFGGGHRHKLPSVRQEIVISEGRTS